MPIPSLITDLAITAALNSPAGGESVTTADDYLRAQAAFIAQLRDRVQPVALGGTGAATANAGADALGAFRRGTLLGTVSQTASVPTGAVIERGSNANGEYVRWADGTQICWGNIQFNTTSRPVWTYPSVFLVGIKSIVGTVLWPDGWRGITTNSDVSASTSSIQFRINDDTAVALSCCVSATGRWF